MIETVAVISIAGFNFLGLAAIYYKLARVETKFKQLPCYSNKEFVALRKKLCQ